MDGGSELKITRSKCREIPEPRANLRRLGLEIQIEVGILRAAVSRWQKEVSGGMARSQMNHLDSSLGHIAKLLGRQIDQLNDSIADPDDSGVRTK